MNFVHLEPMEMLLAEFVGKERNERSIRAGRKNQKKDTNRSDEEINIDGAAGEMAVAQYLDVYWNPSVDTFRGRADLGRDIEVRHTRHENGHLIIKPGDVMGRKFVLVIGTPPSFRIAGWAEYLPRELAQYRQEEDKTYWIPQKHLEDVNCLLNREEAKGSDLPV